MSKYTNIYLIYSTGLFDDDRGSEGEVLVFPDVYTSLLDARRLIRDVSRDEHLSEAVFHRRPTPKHAVKEILKKDRGFQNVVLATYVSKNVKTNLRSGDVWWSIIMYRVKNIPSKT